MKKNRKIEKLEIFTQVLNLLKQLSISQTKKQCCIALKKDFTKIASFGYNGSFSGAPISDETGGEEESLEPGKSGFIHAEINMIAKFRENDPENYIVLITQSPCKMCTKTLVNAGFNEIYWIEEYRETSHLKEILDRLDIKYGKINEYIQSLKE